MKIEDRRLKIFESNKTVTSAATHDSQLMTHDSATARSNL